MSDVVRWDWATLFIYLLLMFLIGYSLKRALYCKNNGIKLKFFNIEINFKYIYYFLVFVVLLLFMCSRVITEEIGGADSARYRYFFETFGYTEFHIKNILTMHGWEYLFFNLMYLIRIMGGSFTLFMYVVYSLLLLGYLYYFDRNVNNENEWFISLIFILPYLKSMNTLRNCLAASIGLFSLEAIRKDRKVLFVVFFILAYLTHYISIVLLFFALFCYKFPDKLYNTRKKIIFISFGCFFATIICIPIIKKILLMTRYAGYINRIAFSPWGYLFYILVFVLILLSYDDFIKTIKSRNHMIFYKMIVFLSIVVPPFTVVNGTQRLLMYFEIPRFIMYGDLYKVYEDKIIPSKRKAFKFGIICIYIAWIVFRIWRMFEVSKIMPYENIWFV